MSMDQKGTTGEVARSLPRAHEWEMVTGFVLGLQRSSHTDKECLIEPVASTLRSYGLEDAKLIEMCADVEKAGEEMRASCGEGKLDCINVRIHLTSQAIHGVGKDRPWAHFLVKQIVSSESDNLNSIDDPCCYIDLHIYRQS